MFLVMFVSPTASDSPSIGVQTGSKVGPSAPVLMRVRALTSREAPSASVIERTAAICIRPSSDGPSSIGIVKRCRRIVVVVSNGLCVVVPRMTVRAFHTFSSSVAFGEM